MPVGTPDPAAASRRPEPQAPWAALAPLRVRPQRGVPGASVMLGAGGQPPWGLRGAALRRKVLLLRGESLPEGQFVLGTQGYKNPA